MASKTWTDVDSSVFSLKDSTILDNKQFRLPDKKLVNSMRFQLMLPVFVQNLYFAFQEILSLIIRLISKYSKLYYLARRLLYL